MQNVDGIAKDIIKRKNVEYSLEDIDMLFMVLKDKKFAVDKKCLYNPDFVALLASFANDFKGTLKTITKKGIHINELQNDPKYLMSEELIKKIYDIFKDNNFKFTINKKIENLNKENLNLNIFNSIPLIVSLANNPTDTYSLMHKNNAENSVGYLMRISDFMKNETLELLLNQHYVIPDDSQNVVTNEYFIGASLLNDFDYTAKLITKYKLNENFQDQDFWEETQEKLINKLIADKYVLDKKTIDNVKLLPEILTVSLHNDREKTKRLFFLIMDDAKKDEKYFDNFEVEELENFQELMGDEIDYEKDLFTRILVSKFIKTENRQEAAKMIVDDCKKYNFKYTSLPKAILMQEGVLKEIYGNDKIQNFILNHIGNESVYDEKHEKALLSLIDPTSTKIEDYVLKIKDKKRDELSLLEVFSLEYYAKKVVSTNGVKENYMIDLFRRSKEGDLGLRLKGNIVIYNNGYNESVGKIIETLHHECSHAILFDLIEKENVDEMLEIDEDVDVYCKDYILAKLLKGKENEYYNNNYKCISYEFDAEFRAKCMSAKILGTEENMNFETEELYKKSIREIVDRVYEENKYYESTYLRKHNGETYNLNDLFIMELKKADYDFVKETIARYPILKYDINVKFDAENKIFTVERKSITQIVEEIGKADKLGEEKDKKVYLKILERRCNEELESDNVRNNKEEFRLAIKDLNPIPEWVRDVYEEIKKNDEFRTMIIKKYAREDETEEEIKQEGVRSEPAASKR